MQAGGAIGVFDSGVGGLSVLRHIRRILPGQRLFYVADSAHVPYGDKSPHYIEQRALAIRRFLVQRGAVALVIACNTASAAAASTLRHQFALPVIAMEPAIKPAVAATRSGIIGILATTGTLESARFAALLERYTGTAEIVTQGCAGLVEQIERGDLAGPATRRLVERYTAPLLARGADTLVLGCTHYPFVEALITEVVGSDVVLIDTGAAVAREVQRRLQQPIAVAVADAGAALDHETPDNRTIEFWTSGDAQIARNIIPLLWRSPVAVQQLPAEFM